MKQDTYREEGLLEYSSPNVCGKFIKENKYID
jgi:hypothetical protein